VNNIFIGFIAICGVLFFSIGDKYQSYFQIHSVIIVGGGTVAILIFSTPNAVLKSLWANLKAMLGPERTMISYRDHVLKLSESRNAKIPISHKLVEYAQELWSQGIDPDLFIVLLSQKRKELESKTIDAVQALKNLAKYPPTLGMTGTVMGMINLFSTLDSNKGNVGEALSTAMTATFFGLIIANILISPVADRLHVRQVGQSRLLDNLYELLLLINQGEPSTLIREELDERAA